MAYNKTVYDFDSQTIENADGTLKGLTIVKRTRVKRISDDGRELDSGWAESTTEEMEVPLHKVSTLMAELAMAMEYYANGQAAADRRDPVSWPNSLNTVDNHAV